MPLRSIKPKHQNVYKAVWCVRSSRTVDTTGSPRGEGGEVLVCTLSAKDRTRKKNSIDKHGDAFETTYAREKREGGGNDGTVDHRRNFDGFNDFSLLVLLFFFSFFLSVVSVLSRRDILWRYLIFECFFFSLFENFLSYFSDESLHLLHHRPSQDSTYYVTSLPDFSSFSSSSFLYSLCSSSDGF